MSEDVIVYTNPISRGRLVRWMLEEVGCPYRTEVVDYGTPMKSPDYLALNPMGKVPTIRHGNQVVTPVEAAVSAHAMKAEPQDQRQEGMAGYGSFARVMDTLEKSIPAEGYITGARFSGADLYLGAHFGWGLQWGTIEKRPGFEACWQRVSDRDAYRRAKELDDAIMPKEAEA